MIKVMIKIIHLFFIIACAACAYSSGAEGKMGVCALNILAVILNFIALMAQVYG